MSNERLSYLLHRHAYGLITDEERLELGKYFDSNDNKEVHALLDELAATGVPFFEQEQSRADKIFSDVMHQRESRKIRKINFRRIYVAASLFLLIIISSIVFLNNKRAVIQQSVKAIHSEKQNIKYAVLPDSSRLILNRNTALTYLFAGNNRTVNLAGEAFFDIKHDAYKPFVVNVGRIKITVLGTAFNIKTYDNGSVAVTVSSGKVKVENSKGTIAMLEPNQQVTVDTVSGYVSKTLVNTSDVTSWNRDDLKFDDATLSEVALAIEMKFNVKVEFSEPTLINSRITALLRKGESLDDVLKIVTKVNGMQYSMTNNHVLISSK